MKSPDSFFGNHTMSGAFEEWGRKELGEHCQRFGGGDAASLPRDRVEPKAGATEDFGLREASASGSDAGTLKDTECGDALKTLDSHCAAGERQLRLAMWDTTLEAENLRERYETSKDYDKASAADQQGYEIRRGTQPVVALPGDSDADWHRAVKADWKNRFTSKHSATAQHASPIRRSRMGRYPDLRLFWKLEANGRLVLNESEQKPARKDIRPGMTSL